MKMCNQVWQSLAKQVFQHDKHWSIVKGPLAAGLAYLKDALWEAHDLETWVDPTGQSWPVDVRDPDFYWRFAERFQFCKDLLGWHIASHWQGGQGLEQGGDLFVAKKHRKQLAKEKGSDLPLLDLMLQGGLYHGSQTGFEPCPLCSAEDGLFHRLWQCPAMLHHVGDVPPDWAPHDVDETAFWCRGIPPISWSQVSPGPPHLQGTGIWANLIPVSTAGLIFATDGSGGPLSKEPRLRQVGFGVVALAAVGPHSIVGTLVGTIPGRQTVPRAEAFAFLKLLEMTEGPVQSCIDAKAVFRKWKKLKDITQLSADLDIWGPLARQKKERAEVEIHWTRSHLSKPEHERLFPDQQWMHQANAEADHTASTFADQLAESLNLRAKQELLTWVDARVHRIQTRLIEVARFWLSQKEPGISKPLQVQSSPKPATRSELIQFLHVTHSRHLWGPVLSQGYGSRRCCTRCELTILAYWGKHKVSVLAGKPCFSSSADFLGPVVHPSHRLTWCSDPRRHRCVQCRAQGTTAQLFLKPSWRKPCARETKGRRL